SQALELDLATVEPSVAGPRRPQDRVPLREAAASFARQLPGLLAPTAEPLGTRTAAVWERKAVADAAVAGHAKEDAAPSTPLRSAQDDRLFRGAELATTTVKERF